MQATCARCAEWRAGAILFAEFTGLRCPLRNGAWPARGPSLLRARRGRQRQERHRNHSSSAHSLAVSHKDYRNLFNRFDSSMVAKV
jgi:hypothetical protein